MGKRRSKALLAYPGLMSILGSPLSHVFLKLLKRSPLDILIWISLVLLIFIFGVMVLVPNFDPSLYMTDLHEVKRALYIIKIRFLKVLVAKQLITKSGFQCLWLYQIASYKEPFHDQWHRRED